MHELVQEVEYSVGLWAGDRLDFIPLGELVVGHQDSVEPPGAVGRGLIISSPQQANDQLGGMVTSL
jgi:hypothetical protein